MYWLKHYFDISESRNAKYNIVQDGQIFLKSIKEYGPTYVLRRQAFEVILQVTNLNLQPLSLSKLWFTEDHMEEGGKMSICTNYEKQESTKIIKANEKDKEN